MAANERRRAGCASPWSRGHHGLRARGDIWVSTARPVPETWHLTGDGPRRALTRSGRLRPAPGPAGQLLTQAVDQAHRAGASHRYVALVVGLVGALLSGSTLMGQLERGLNRLYGIERDRSTLRKYGLALVLALSAGMLATVA